MLLVPELFLVGQQFFDHPGRGHRNISTISLMLFAHPFIAFGKSTAAGGLKSFLKGGDQVCRTVGAPVQAESHNTTGNGAAETAALADTAAEARRCCQQFLVGAAN